MFKLKKSLCVILFSATCSSVALPAEVQTQPNSGWIFNEKGESELIVLSNLLARELNWQMKIRKKSNVEIVKEYVEKYKILLQKKDAPINQPSAEGVTPLMQAAAYHQLEIIDLLIQAGADTALVDKKGRTALKYLSLIFGKADYILIKTAGDIFNTNYTKKRRNACVDLLTKNRLQRILYKQWI